MFLISLLLWTLLRNYVVSTVVEVEQGLLRGELRQRSTGNGHFFSFKGIPYAAPPVGELRFKAPQPALKWSGVRNAAKHGSICPQVEYGTDKYIPGKEDCLFLNVYTPTLNSSAFLEVMFFIHGGGYVSGSGNDGLYGPDFLIDHDVIVVTINYRLGALGFLCLDTKEAPGNAGLKDQVAALRWVNKNIHEFGGDPSKVTIFGQSVGGSSVTLHVLSPLSKGLFKRAISLSGVFLDDYFYPIEPKRHGLLLVHKLGLYTQDPHIAFKYLQNVSVESIVTADPNVLALDKLKNYVIKKLPFPPVVEKQFGNQPFMLENPEQLLQKGKTNVKEIIIGHTSEEGVSRGVTQKDYNFEVYPYYKEMLVPTSIYTHRSPRTVLKLADCIQNHYMGDKEISETNMKEFIKLYSYLIYVSDIHRYAEMWIKGGNKAYFYKFSCFSERNVNGIKGLKYGIKGAGHLDDLMYLFDGKKYNITLNKNSPSYKMIVQTCKLFTNFAKFGNPTPDASLGATWQPNERFLNIDLKITSQKPNLTEINFWRRMFHSVGIRFS